MTNAKDIRANAAGRSRTLPDFHVAFEFPLKSPHSHDRRCYGSESFQQICMYVANNIPVPNYMLSSGVTTRSSACGPEEE